MRSIVLCEGVDDAYILGYYLFKTQGWQLVNEKELSVLYKLPRKANKKQYIDVYEKNDNSIAIWSAGGKDCFGNIFDFVVKTNKNHPEEGIDQLIIVTDRDRDQVQYCLTQMQKELMEHGILVSELCNRESSYYQFEIEGDSYCLKVSPLIIPFDQEGALETVLMNGLASMCTENAYVVKNAVSYIDRLVCEGDLVQYLKHARQVLKAKFSSTIAVINPERSTATYDRILTAFEWEKHEAVKQNFRVLDEWL